MRYHYANPPEEHISKRCSPCTTVRFRNLRDTTFGISTNISSFNQKGKFNPKSSLNPGVRLVLIKMLRFVWELLAMPNPPIVKAEYWLWLQYPLIEHKKGELSDVE